MKTKRDRVNLSTADLRQALVEAGGLLDVTAAASVLGVSRQAFAARWKRERAKEQWLRFPQPIGYRATHPIWTAEQIKALAKVDAQTRIVSSDLV